MKTLLRIILNVTRVASPLSRSMMLTSLLLWSTGKTSAGTDKSINNAQKKYKKNTTKLNAYVGNKYVKKYGLEKADYMWVKKKNGKWKQAKPETAKKMYKDGKVSLCGPNCAFKSKENPFSKKEQKEISKKAAKYKVFHDSNLAKKKPKQYQKKLNKFYKKNYFSKSDQKKLKFPGEKGFKKAKASSKSVAKSKKAKSATRSVAGAKKSKSKSKSSTKSASKVKKPRSSSKASSKTKKSRSR